MKFEEDSLDQLADQLAELKPAKLDAQLAHRLEMAMHQADEDVRKPASIIYHPFVQWSVAAAAMFVALMMAYDSTRVVPENAQPATVAQAPVEQKAETVEPDPVYQFSNGKLVPVSGREMLAPASYEGLHVYEGRAYRQFRSGGRVILVAPKRINQ